MREGVALVVVLAFALAGAACGAITSQGSCADAAGGASTAECAAAGSPAAGCAPGAGEHAALASVPAGCSAASTLSLSLDEDGTLRAVDGLSCRLLDAGAGACLGRSDSYACGECAFESSAYAEGVYVLRALDCAAPCAAQYCCTLESTTELALGYVFGESQGGAPSSAGDGGAAGSDASCQASLSCSSCPAACELSCTHFPSSCLAACYETCQACCL